jgi:hypothetical protein
MKRRSPLSPRRHTRRRLGAAAIALALAALMLPAAAPDRAAAAAPPYFVGLQGYDDPSRSGFERLNRAKVNTWRTNLSWASVEGTRGKYNWDRYDRLFKQAAINNVRIFPVLIASPKWASSSPKYPPTSSEGRERYFKFAKAAVRRYGPNGTWWQRKPYARALRPKYFQVWNEPNLPSYWNNRPDAPDYGRFLKTTSEYMNSQDPEVRVVAAALVQSDCSSGPCIDEFLRGMFTVRGLGDAIDAVAVNAYTCDYTGILYRLDLARNEVRRALGKSKHMFVTEFGWSTGGSHPCFTTTYSGQAQRLRDAYNRLIANQDYYNLLGAYWFSLKDTAQTSSWLYYLGLFDRYGRDKPAWRSLVEITGGRPGSGALP